MSQTRRRQVKIPERIVSGRKVMNSHQHHGTVRRGPPCAALRTGGALVLGGEDEGGLEVSKSSMALG